MRFLWTRLDHAPDNTIHVMYTTMGYKHNLSEKEDLVGGDPPTRIGAAVIGRHFCQSQDLSVTIEDSNVHFLVLVPSVPCHGMRYICALLTPSAECADLIRPR